MLKLEISTIICDLFIILSTIINIIFAITRQEVGVFVFLCVSIVSICQTSSCIYNTLQRIKHGA